MAQVHGALSNLYYKKAASFGNVPVGNYAALAFYSSTLAATRPLEEDPVLGRGQWDPADAVEGITDHAGQLAVPLCVNQLGHWLTLLLGEPVTSDDTGGDYTHVWKSGALTLPSGVAELALRNDLVHQHIGLMANSLSLSTARAGGYGRASFDMVGQKEVKLGASAAGAPTNVPLDQVLAFKGQLLIDDVAVASVTQADLSYTNNLAGQEGLNAEGLQTGFERGVPAFTGSLTARYTDATLFDMADQHTPFALELKWVKAANKSLSIRAGRVKMPKPQVGLQGPGGVSVTYNFTGAADAAEADGRMMVVTLKNQTASYA
ncbi:MAG: phage tail tube protein [Parvibaculaceae bacterium]|nr:phage tail tube protein [Parvibaculaceae bacterium]